MHRYFADANVLDEDSDEDIQIQSITQNLKCPLTLQYYEEPMKARCGHIFDKSALYDMFSQRSVNAQSLPCPQSGCNNLVTKEELKLDRPTLRLVESAKEKEREINVEAMSDERDVENDGEFVTV
ncbi:E3 SUMO-protein ligase NSE2 [Neolecta irregularis DAH-3]|uniref:E3 SUMO-protein ligase NSE2 n=1 Tax=Neolecta irregularis (strain DAH-3) TaxID=1198029 RepID=A0A1U7LWJ9_NEOID|nr:E3 SUMO-protein ligase NSE2 [Neolecta irregularis DAH-3]|eukprot:OLL26922.1 E3 SUMO-protein ligase NSE2 [Neolecta irregularis DAH-3]